MDMKLEWKSLVQSENPSQSGVFIDKIGLHFQNNNYRRERREWTLAEEVE